MDRPDKEWYVYVGALLGSYLALGVAAYIYSKPERPNTLSNCVNTIDKQNKASATILEKPAP